MITKPYTGCVYAAVNRLTGKTYVGKAIRGMASRRKHHEYMSVYKKPRGFAAAIAKYGPSCFDWCELFLSDVDEELLAAEKYIIQQKKLAGVALYNLTEGGDGAAGYKRSRDSIERGIEKWRKWYESTGQREILSARAKSRRHSEESKKKIGAASKGRKMSEGTKAKLLATNTGRPMPQHTRERMGVDRSPSPETLGRMRAAQKKRWEEQKKDPARMAAHREAIKKDWERRRKVNAGGGKGEQSKAQTAKPTNNS